MYGAVQFRNSIQFLASRSVIQSPGTRPAYWLQETFIALSEVTSLLQRPRLCATGSARFTEKEAASQFILLHRRASSTRAQYALPKSQMLIHEETGSRLILSVERVVLVRGARAAKGITHSARPKQLAKVVLYAEAIYTSTHSTRWISAPIGRWPLRICRASSFSPRGRGTPGRPLTSELARRD